MNETSLEDELTGVYSRRGFAALATQQLKVAERVKRGAILLYADLDELDFINQNFGREEGDNALRDTADILRQGLRDADIIARLGGDEFVGLTVENEQHSGDPIIDRLTVLIDEHNKSGKRPYPLSISFGWVRFDPEVPCTLEVLLEFGDRRMRAQRQARTDQQKAD